MKNLGNLMKQAQQMQSKMAEMQARLSEMEATGSSGGGMIQVTVSGKHQLKKITIDKSLVNPEEIEILEDLILAAFNDAAQKVETAMQDEMAKVTGGLNLPTGFKLPF